MPGLSSGVPSSCAEVGEEVVAVGGGEGEHLPVRGGEREIGGGA